jgi:glycosyltransferase involved in cell wall biosynthesis
MWNYISDSLQQLFTFDQSKLFSVDYGVDLERFRPYPRAELGDLYAALRLPRDRKLVVYLGVLSAYQGVDLLLESIPRVLAACPDTHFLVMGYPDEERYRARARALGVAGNITLPGRVDYSQAARHLSLGDVAVSAKLTPMEGNGKLLNYLACGLPTVAFDLPGNLAALGDVGRYAPTGDSAALADRLIGLLRDPGERAELSRRSRALAEERYSWQAIGARINAVYDELLARRRRGASAPYAAPKRAVSGGN